MKLIEKINSWVNERYDLTEVEKLIKHKKVPVHRGTLWYYMGGVTLFLFIIQAVTGILLLMYYRPGEDSSYESLRYILTEVEFGWLIRNIHSWAANLMILFAFIHMFSVFFTKSYEKPREMTWVSGFVLLLLAMTFGFSGYLLPWNELAFFATKVGTNIVGSIPFIGKELMIIIRGGEEVTGATLSRFFGLHVAILPALFTLLLSVHLMMVQKQGMSEPAGFKNSAQKKYIRFFPDFALRDAFLWMCVLYLLAVLAVFFQWDLGLKADALSPAPEGIKPEWYFMFMFQILKFLPPHVLFLEGETFGIILISVAAVVWMFIPFIKFRGKLISKSKFIQTAGIVIVAIILILTIWGYI